MKMRSLGISTISVLLTAAVVGNAYYQKKQFYPSVVYITKSNGSMTVIYVQFFVIVLMLGKLLRKIFLGNLRAAEFEHLMERFWYALTETCLAFTVFRDDFNPRFVALFTVLLFLKSFHWLAEERVDYMERSPIIGWLFHVRVASLLSILGLIDYLMILHAYNSTISKGATVQLVFGFEYSILITVVANITIKYILHAAEMRADTPWENKAVFLLYTELVIGLIRVILYLLFVLIMARIYALPMFVFRPMFYTIRNFKKALNDVIMSRRAIRNMNTLYPDATPEELEMSDNICIICREDMVSNSKKLPCGHIFHTACLRSWFQRQQTCPTCRLNILRTAHTSSVPRSNQVPNTGNLNQNNNASSQQTPVFNLNNNNNNITTSSSGINNNFSNSSALPFVLPPPFSFVTPYAVPPPPVPPGLSTLTDEEVRALEGNERRHVEERIKLLRNIQLLLDASVSLMNQYSTISARLPPMPTPVVHATSVSSTTQQEPQPGTSTQNLNTNSNLNNSAQPTSSSSTSSNINENILKSEVIIIKKLKTQSGNTNDTDEINLDSTKSNNNDSLKNSDTSSKNNNINKDEILIEDIGSEDNISNNNYKNPEPCSSNSLAQDTFDNNSDNSELSEIRRRRLQKFI